MHKAAHRYFAGGCCAVMCLLFGFTAYSIMFLVPFAMWAGALPDADQRLPFMDHRGFSHTPVFALIVILPLTILVIYIQWIINSLVGLKIFTTSVLDLNAVPVPGSLVHFISGDMLSFFQDAVTLTFFALFIAMLTHITLDVITPSGLDIWKWHLNGGILSEEPTTNKLFMVTGIFMIVASIALSIVSMYSTVSNTALFLMIFMILVIVAVFIASIFIRDKKYHNQLNCYSVDGESFCTRKKCVYIKGKKVCVKE